MNKITFKEARDISDNAIVADEGSWRWGSTTSYVFARDGKHYMFTMRYHVEEGIQNDGDVLIHEVRPVETIITKWVKV